MPVRRNSEDHARALHHGTPDRGGGWVGAGDMKWYAVSSRLIRSRARRGTVAPWTAQPISARRSSTKRSFRSPQDKNADAVNGLMAWGSWEERRPTVSSACQAGPDRPVKQRALLPNRMSGTGADSSSRVPGAITRPSDGRIG